MNNWKEIEIAEACSVIVDCLNRTAPKVDYETPFKMIRTSNVRYGRIDLEKVFYVDRKTFEKWTRREIPRKNDIILTREAPLGEVGLLRTDDSVFLGQRTVLYRANEEVCDPFFLYYSLLGPVCQASIRSFGSGSTVEHMKVPDSKKILLPLPPLPTQRKIAAILSAYDDLIENNLRRIRLLEELAQRTYEEWFVRLKFPGHENTPVDQETGLPVGWREVSFPQIVQVNPRTKLVKGTVAPYVPMGSLSESLMVIDPIEERAVSGGAKFKNGDTLFARITPCLENGKTGFVQFMESEDQVASGSTEFIVLRETDECGRYFIYCTAREDRFRENAIKSMVGSDGRQRVKTDSFDKYFVNQAPQDLRGKFEDKAKSIFKTIHNLTHQNRLLREARDILLPRLMTGRVRV